MRADEIRQLLLEKNYRSLKEWRIDNNHSYRVACTLGKQRELAEEFKMEYNFLSGVQAFHFRSYEEIIGVLRDGNVRTTNELRTNFNTLYRCLKYNGWLDKARGELKLTKEYRRRK